MKENPTCEELEKQVQELKKELRDAQALTEEIMVYMTEGLVLTDTRGTVTFINQRLSDMLGYPSEQIVGKYWLDMVPPEQQTLAQAAEVRRAQGYTDRYEIVLRRKDGQKFPVKIGAGPRFDRQSGEFVGTMGVVTDITERRQAEEALGEKTRFLQKIIDTASDLVSVTDMAGNFKFIGPSHSILGYELDSLVGRNVMELVHPDDYQAIAAAFAEFLANREDGRKVEYRYRRADGDYLWFETVGKFLFDDAGNPKEILFRSRDLTARKQAEAEIENARDQYQSLVNNIPGVVYRCKLDKDWTMLFMSDAIDTLSGYPASDFIGNAVRTFESVIHPDDTDFVAQSVNSAFTEGRPWNIEYRICHKDGDIRWVQEKGRKISFEDGSDASLDGFILDITDRRQAEEERETLQEQLRQAQKMESVGRLAGGIAHDFNNMLGVILGHVEFSLEKIGENHGLSAGLKEIQIAAQRSADLTKQLLTFARKQIISPIPLELNDTVESMLNMLRRLIGEGIDLVWKPAAHTWPVKMDPSQINQILVNLCINARDAIAGVGRLTMETGIKTFDDAYCRRNQGFIPGDYVLLSVSDNGCGMDKETLKNLFEPFFTTKEVGQGTGLGLATVYGIVKQNKGFINVYSEPGHGSTFNIYLPRLAEEEEHSREVPIEKTASGGTETILVVEDEHAILKMTRMMLEQKGYTVLTAATPAEALEKVKNHSGAVDLLLSDVVLPEMSGRDLAGQIMGRCPGIRVLFMSGYTADVIAHQGVLNDGVAFIQKPFSLSDLTEKVRGVLDETKGKFHF